MPKINMGKIICQLREKYQEVKTKTVKEIVGVAFEFCKELVEHCIPEFYYRIFSILKPSKSASYGLFLLYILQVDECELKWQVRLQPSLLWNFHGDIRKFLSRKQKREHSNKLEELFAPVRNLFQFLLTPGKFDWNHPHIIIEKIFSYYFSAFELKDKVEGIDYWFVKVAILLIIFTKIKVRDLATVKWVALYPKLTLQSLGNEEWLNLKIPS
jgi:hypothetical protein